MHDFCSGLESIWNRRGGTHCLTSLLNWRWGISNIPLALSCIPGEMTELLLDSELQTGEKSFVTASRIIVRAKLGFLFGFDISFESLQEFAAKLILDGLCLLILPPVKLSFGWFASAHALSSVNFSARVC